MKTIGIRREDKSRWEKRVPLIPDDIRGLMEKGMQTHIQPSSIRCYPDAEFSKIGASVREDLSNCDLLIGIKEMPVHFIHPNKPHLFFSHTIKGQSHNMLLLKTILEKKATLIDYERIVDEKNRRLIAFGRFAGLAGIIDTLSILGKRMKKQGMDMPLSEVKLAHEYRDLAEAKMHVQSIGNRMKNTGKETEPFVIGITGYGNVSQGVQEIVELLPLKKIPVKDIPTCQEKLAYAIFKEEDMFFPKEGAFELQDYFKHPQRYASCFVRYLPYLTAIVNCIYWDEKCPRLVTIEDLQELFSRPSRNRLQVIGDISCDVHGSIECTVKTTDPGSPSFVFDPISKKTTDGWEGEGVAILAVDILPSEFSVDASVFFSEKLREFVPTLLQGDFGAKFEQCGLPPSLKTAVIVWKGELTPDYRYLEKFLE